MKKYQCHKIVTAMKIDLIKVHTDGNATLTCLNPRFEQHVGQPWMHKHEPEEGGYFVRYEDSYSSYSPAEAFEAGYTEIK